MRRNSIKLAATILFLLMALTVHSHPHTFMRTQVELVFSESGLEGFWIEWDFDHLFTRSIISDFDRNRDGVFSADEIAEIYEFAFSNLQHFNYFTRVFHGDKEYPVSDVSDFSAYLKGDTLHYRFYVPFKLPYVKNAETVVHIAIFDNTYFCAIDYHEDNPVKTKKPQGVSVRHAIETNRQRRIEYPENDLIGVIGVTYPFELVVRFKKDN